MGKPADKQSAEPAPPRRRGCRRRAGCLALLLLLAALLLAAVFLTADAIRRSQWVADLILAEVQSATGLETSAQALRIEWDGTTTVEGLTLAIPNLSEPLLTVERTTLNHHPLYLVGLTRSLGLHTVHVESPVLRAEPITEADGAPGDWSPLLAVQRLLASLPEGGAGGTPDIPAITIDNGRIVLAPATGDAVEVPFSLRSTPTGPLGFDLAFDAPGLASATGSAAAGAEWRHALQIQADPDPDLWARLVHAAGLDPIDTPTLAAAWTGQLTPRGIAGVLNLETARAGGYGATGSLRLLAGDTIRVEPGALDVTAPQLPPVRITDGRVTLRGLTAQIAGVEITAADQAAIIDGSINLEQLDGRADLAFRGTAPGGLAHHGHGSLELRTPAGRPTLTGVINLSGRSDTSALNATAEIDLAGETWTSYDIQVHFPRLEATHNQTPADLAGLRIAAHAAPDLVRLLDVRLPDAERTSVQGEFSPDTLAWSLDADLRQWRPTTQTPALDVSANLRGVRGRIDDWFIAATDGRIELAGAGYLDPQAAEPLSADIRVRLTQTRVATDPAPIDPVSIEQGATVQAGPKATDPLLPRNMTADIAGAFKLRGTLEPLQLAGEVELRTTGLIVGDAAFEDVVLLGAATVNTDRIELDIQPCELLGGALGVVARSDWRSNITADAHIEGIDLEAVATLLGLEAPLKGVADATLSARADSGDLDAVVASGQWTATGLTLGPLLADSGAGVVGYARGVLTIEETTLRRADGAIEARAVIPLSDLARVDTIAEARAYPVEAAGFDARVTGVARGTLDLIEQLADVDILGHADIAFEGAHVAGVDAEGMISGRTLRFDSLTGDFGEGSLRGSAVVPLDDITQATADLEITALPPAAFAGVVPPASEIRGTAHGRITIAPADDPRAQAPSHLRVALDFDNGAWRTIELGRIAIDAYVGPRQSVLQRAVLEAAGGQLEVWGSTNLHNDERYVQVSGRADRLELAQLTDALAPEAGTLHGRVGAQFGAGGYLAEQHRMFGNATVTITDSDLINIPLVSQVYSVLSVGSGNGQPRGAGAAEIHLEGESLRIPRAQYNSRGTEVRLSLEVADVFHPERSPIAGVAVGIARPLSGANTTLTGSADRLLAAAQEGGTAIRIGGTLGEPRVRVVPLAELQSLVSRIFAPITD